MSSPPAAPVRRPWAIPAIGAALAFLLVLGSIDGAGVYPMLGGGPGITIDESFNVQQGVRLAVGAKGWLLGAVTWREIFGEPKHLGPNAPLGYHLPDHPPLGRLWLGVWHEAILSIASPAESPGPFVTVTARCGSAVAFALTVFFIALATRVWYGRAASVAASAALVLSPRLFGHAHLAALETVTNLTFVAATLAVAQTWNRTEPPRFRVAALCGALFGLALLTKIQAIFLPPALLVWTLCRWKGRGLPALAIWGTTAAAVFFIGWPWLWLDPWNHMLQFLGRTTDRAVLHVYYAGRVWADREVPWHYPWTTFAVTTPLPWLLLGIVGAAKAWMGPRTPNVAAPAPVATPARKRPWSGRCGNVASRLIALIQSREGLILGAILVPLVLFSVPGVAVYDGERLFLTAFPLWALLVGRAFGANHPETNRSAATTSIAPARSWLRASALLVAVALGAWDVMRVAPCWLSGYSVLVGQERGAQALGFEANYWADSVTQELLNALADAAEPGATVGVAPVLHALQLPELIAQSPSLRRKKLRLEPFAAARRPPWLLIFERHADLPAELPRALSDYESAKSIERGGVRLAAAYRLRTAVLEVPADQ